VSASRAYATIVGRFRWRFDTRARAWTVLGRRDIRIVPVILKARGGRLHPAWRLEPSARIYREYTDAMIDVDADPPSADHRPSRRS